MKNKILLFSALFVFILNASAQESVIKDVFEKFVEDKVERMQKLIGFDDNQATELKEVEFNFLLDVNAAENCFWCRTKKRVEKLNKKREEGLQKILTREQYIKYDAIDNDRIRKDPPLRLK
ncbi:MAG: hypothetical protein PHO84_09730 [Dysgonamonadaceae bacterium]|jgi:hypothetical protein|nr:hypothetical protein [Dysgonamonadaceae bacterium]MDD3357020.1 hypothetical protein [Dysgonamonadaceae bacterium]MDD4247418.1 hypothetical protein [Dysgonamonadaceae bacterium]MDD4606331.1 hypothetical protein [Dysgonamonadaceae bacterium]HTN68229.1 hypothetical protein [Dysgonamonadaceae bacterium]